MNSMVNNSDSKEGSVFGCRWSGSNLKLLFWIEGRREEVWWTVLKADVGLPEEGSASELRC